MSIPSLIYRCDQCDFAGGDYSIWQRKEYVLDDGALIPLKSKLGWCSSCNNVRDIERLTVKPWQQDLAEATSKQAGSNQVNNKTLWQRAVDLLLWKRTRRLSAEHEKRLQDCLKDITDSKKGLNLLQKRESPPKCLTCGSTRVISHFFHQDSEETLDMGLDGETDSQSTPDLPFHPGCGGHLQREMSDTRFMVRPVIKRYSPEGDYLETIQIGM